MLVNEMILQVNLGVQKVASFQVDTLLNEETLIELNKSQLAFIKQRYETLNKYGKGFEQSQRRIDDIRTLLMERTFTTIYGGEVFTKIFMDYIDFGVIADQGNIDFEEEDEYMWLVNHKSLLYLDKCGEIAWDRDNVVPFEDPRVPIAINSRSANLQQTVEELSSGQGTEIRSREGKVRGNGSTVIDDPKAMHQFHNQYVVTNSGPDPEAFQLTIAANKWVQHDDIYMLLKDPFNTTERFFPLTTINDNLIEVYTDDTFIVAAVKMRYIRRPLTMSVVAGVTTQECELPTHVHETIVDMTIDRILEGFADPRFRSHQAVTAQTE